MLDVIKTTYWKTVYRDDVCEKLKWVEKCMEAGDTEQMEYWYVLTFNSAFRLMKAYYASMKGKMFFKNKVIFANALKDELLADKESWELAFKMTERIARAVRAKEENVEIIQKNLVIFYKLIETFDEIIKNADK